MFAFLFLAVSLLVTIYWLHLMKNEGLSLLPSLSHSPTPTTLPTSLCAPYRYIVLVIQIVLTSLWLGKHLEQSNILWLILFPSQFLFFLKLIMVFVLLFTIKPSPAFLMIVKALSPEILTDKQFYPTHLFEVIPSGAFWPVPPMSSAQLLLGLPALFFSCAVSCFPYHMHSFPLFSPHLNGVHTSPVASWGRRNKWKGNLLRSWMSEHTFILYPHLIGSLLVLYRISVWNYFSFEVW